MAEISSKLKQKNRMLWFGRAPRMMMRATTWRRILRVSLDLHWKRSSGSALVVIRRRRRSCWCCLWVACFATVFCHNADMIPTRRSAGCSFLVYKRPFVEDFLKFCFERFEVGIWSSAKEWNIDYALNSLMRSGLRQKLAFIWDQKKCTKSGFNSLENSSKQVYLKDLKHVWHNKYGDLPWSMGHFSAADTLMIGNEPYKSLLNPPNTAMFLPEYYADDLDDKVLGTDSGLRKYLDEVAEAHSVREYVKAHPFGLPAVTRAHPHWDFYSKIIKEHSASSNWNMVFC